MKQLLNYIIICYLGICFSFAQNYVDNKIILEQEKLMHIDLLNHDGIKKSSQNMVFINQEGSNNFSEVKIKAQKSDVKVFQYGDGNYTLIDVHAKNIKEKVVQIGTDNSFIDINHLNHDNHNVDIYQNGSKQKIIMNGVNTITKGLKIKLVGDRKMMFINNYKN